MTDTILLPLVDVHDADHPPPAVVPKRGRPAVPLPPYERELRITPVDGKPIKYADWMDLPPLLDASGLLGLSAWEEGGEGTDKALHYHAVIRTTWSVGLLRTYILHVARDKHQRGGNKVYRSAECHEHTYGYVAKYGQCAIAMGDYHTCQDDWKERSRAYLEKLKQETERNRKQKALSRKRQLEIIREYAHDQLQLGPSGMPRDPLVAIERFVEFFLVECDKRNFDFPTKFQLETLTIRSLYRYFPEAVHAMYRANMCRIFSLTDR